MQQWKIFRYKREWESEFANNNIMINGRVTGKVNFLPLPLSILSLHPVSFTLHTSTFLVIQLLPDYFGNDLVKG